MSAQTIQHTAPLQVYRQRYWKLIIGGGGLAVAVSLATVLWRLFGNPVYPVSPLLPGFVCVSMLFTLTNTLRNRLVVSPTGISYRLGWQRIETAWSNVERLELIMPAILPSFGPILGLVLREPVPSSGPQWIIPAELRGRAMPLQLNLWERADELERAIYHYAPQVLIHADGQVYRPFDPARIAAEREQRGTLLVLGMVGVVMIIMAIVFVMVLG